MTKNPEDYADKKSQPHVQVALQMKAKGQSIRIHDTIPYVICEGNTDLIASRAHHPDEVKKPNSELKIGEPFRLFFNNLIFPDYVWYLTNQVHPPVARLIQPIEETDAARIAECLGLDSKKYHSVVAADVTAFDEQMFTLESQISDAERFKDVRKWNPKCIHCKERNDFTGLIRQEVFTFDLVFIY